MTNAPIVITAFLFNFLGARVFLAGSSMVLPLHHEVLPVNQSKRRRVGGNDSASMHQRSWRRAYRAGGSKHEWGIPVDIECSRLHAW